MAESKINNNLEPNECVFTIWCRRCPNFEKRYEDNIIKRLTDYGKGTNQYNDARGKVLGPGYEAYILAFFIGLYADRKLSMTKDSSQKKDFGWPIENWTGVDRGNRKKYEDLRQYIFMALVAKTDINWLGVDEGVIPVSEAVSKLITTMEEFANYGFSVMEEKIKRDENFFVSPRSFLDIFFELTMPKKQTREKVNGPDSLGTF